MYHLSGISSLTNSGRSRSNSLASTSSTPLSPSVLDFSEYVSRQCEKKLQRRVRHLNQKCSKQQAAIKRLKQRLATITSNTQPLKHLSNSTTTTLLEEPEGRTEPIDTAEGRGAAVEDTADETGLGLLDGEEQEDEEEEGEMGDEEEGTAKDGQTQSAAASADEEENSKGSEQDELNESIVQSQGEGQQHPAAHENPEEEETDECFACPPCSPISGGRHKRARTDDSELCNTEAIDAQWKRAKDEEEEQQAEAQQIDAAGTAGEAAGEAATEGDGVASVWSLLPLKPALLHPFPTSHAHLHGNNAGASGLTPYRGLLRPFARQNHSPARIAQPAL